MPPTKESGKLSQHDLSVYHDQAYGAGFDTPVHGTDVRILLSHIEAVEAERDALREALETIAKEWDGQLGTGQILTDFCRKALERPE